MGIMYILICLNIHHSLGTGHDLFHPMFSLAFDV